MVYSPITSFRRPIDAVQLNRHRESDVDLPSEAPDKWQLLRELADARQAFGLSDRTLSVLQALLSFFPNKTLSGQRRDLLIFPSNAAICARLNGMPDSTMRRHLRVLVSSGIIGRRDSPNGKRFVRRAPDGTEVYGFDLTPLRQKFAHISATAEKLRAERATVARLRREVSLMRRDLFGLMELGSQTAPGSEFWSKLRETAIRAARTLRRTLRLEELRAISADLSTALEVARNAVDRVYSSERSGHLNSRVDHYEHHHQNTNVDYIESEQADELIIETGAARLQVTNDFESSELQPRESRDEVCRGDSPRAPDQATPRIPLSVVVEVCRELRLFVPERIRDWHEFVRAVAIVRPMIGITTELWEQAMNAMGPTSAAVVVAAMLERQGEIRSPGGYLRHLTKRAEEGAFSCGPMVMALARRTPT